jgi:hypothetical protein
MRYDLFMIPTGLLRYNSARVQASSRRNGLRKVGNGDGAEHGGRQLNSLSASQSAIEQAA